MIPVQLRGLSFADICVLRPLQIHQGQYVVLPHGYRQKDFMTRCSWCELSVQEKINAIEDPEARHRCQRAYQYLVSSSDSSYSKFVALRNRLCHTDRRFNIYDHRQNEGIECALWPCLYPYTSWCESILSGDGTHSSTTRAFLFKVKSEVLDYSTTYDLLQFMYDTWLFLTVSGAITVGIKQKCCPSRSLENKVFSGQYWKWHHLSLVDAVRQFGYPTLFLTLSPYEWTFPFPSWMETICVQQGKAPIKLAALESLHIAHVLEQLVRGYLTGRNSARWTRHLFQDERDVKKQNVINYFYRLEFQNRGTCHVHVLVWLNDLSRTNVSDIRGDVPWTDVHNAFLVQDLQSSKSNALPLWDGPTRVIKEIGDSEVLRISHPIDAFVRNIRGYLASVLPALQCSMDVQVTDQRAMILRYVTSYVSKSNDSQLMMEMFSTEVTP